MRILNLDADTALKQVIIYLTVSEAAELRDSLNHLVTGTLGRHEHVSSEDYDKEVTVCTYGDEVLEQFDERSRRLITSDT